MLYCRSHRDTILLRGMPSPLPYSLDHHPLHRPGHLRINSFSTAPLKNANLPDRPVDQDLDLQKN